MAWFVLINDYMIEISAPLLGEIFPLYLFVILYVWLCCWWVYSSLAVEAWPKFWVWAPMCIHSFYHLSSMANLTFDFNSASVASHGKYKILTTHSDSESIWHTTNYYIESPFWLFSFKNLRVSGSTKNWLFSYAWWFECMDEEARLFKYPFLISLWWGPSWLWLRFKVQMQYPLNVRHRSGNNLSMKRYSIASWSPCIHRTDATGRSLVSCILKAYAAVWFFHLRYKMSWSVSYKRYDSGDLRRLAHLKAKERLCLQQF